MPHGRNGMLFIRSTLNRESRSPAHQFQKIDLIAIDMKKIEKKTLRTMNTLQHAQFIDTIKKSDWRPNVKAPRSINKGFSDMPLFLVEQPKLF